MLLGVGKRDLGMNLSRVNDDNGGGGASGVVKPKLHHRCQRTRWMHSMCAVRAEYGCIKKKV